MRSWPVSGAGYGCGGALGLGVRSTSAIDINTGTLNICHNLEYIPRNDDGNIGRRA
jgi:hypothetical protein